ncbi:CoA transferase [Amycolatopsis sp. GM8]|uniref:CoA transferase n=1 Tax=Amycolatopsis sp. GM8 TaxID=2896530 RepID=UPI001F46E2C6|nr:CoA transferase [Amycolatopsis sp. GM8]
MAEELTEQLRRAWDSPQKWADFDILAELSAVLGGVGISLDDGGGTVAAEGGTDPIVASPLRIGAGASIGLLAKSVAAAALHRDRGGPGQDIAVDVRRTPHRLCPFYDATWERLGGYPVQTSLEVGNVTGLTFFRTADDRWVLPQAFYAGLRLKAQELLDAPLTYEPVARAIARWKGRDLEEAASALGVPMPLVRTLPELLAESQYSEVLADLPLIEVTRIGDAPPQPLPPAGELPFSGLRALGMGHVIAGAGVGRSLALHGADVLNLWTPGKGEHDYLYATANVGVRSSWLDVRADRAELLRLLHGADVFFHNRRPSFMRGIGMTAAEAARQRPGIVYVTISLHGLSGPWAERPGFDQVAGCVSGIMALHGSPDQPALPPIMVVNDYIVSWLSQVGVVAALRRRATEGGSYHVHVSLTRVALWLLSLGILDKGWVTRVADKSEEHRYLDPETFTAETALGRYQGVTDQVSMSHTPGRYDPVLVPRGSSAREWRHEP